MSIGRGLLVGLALVLGACGGSGGGDSSSTTPVAVTPTAPVATQPNTVAITIDGGPAALTSANEIAANTLFATVTVCTPGSTTACKAIDHVQVDTGSTGLRIFSSTLGTSAVPTPITDPATGKALSECVQFADGYSWGSVDAVDVQLGGRTISSLPVHVIGDPAAGAAPSSCVSGPAENTVFAFGANGVLGIGNFLQDCGSACASSAISPAYYVCPTGGTGTGCVSTAVALIRQVPNPVSRFSADNNGVVIQLPSVAAAGATSVSGTLLFGVATQSDNALGSARFYTLNSQGTFVTTSNGTTFNGSFVDSGSNAYFFASTIAVCGDATFFYCPVTSSNVPTTLTETGTITGSNGTTTTITFSVGNADQLFATTFTAFPTLAGPNGGFANGVAGAFDWGLPFFFGRPVYVLIEGNTVGGVSGPALAF